MGRLKAIVEGAELGAGDFLEQYSDTPIGPMLGGTADYLRNFGTERNNWQRYKDAVGAYMDFM